MLESWFPRNFKLNADIVIRNILFSGEDWQIFLGSGETFVLVAKTGLADYWCATGYLAPTLFQRVSFGRSQYSFLVSPGDMQLAPVAFDQDYITYEDGKSFATALAASRKVDSDVSFSEGIFVEHYSIILPTTMNKRGEPDDVLLGRWLSRGTEISAGSVDRMCQLLPCVTESGLLDILQTVHIVPQKTEKPDRNAEDKRQEPFSLPGRSELETFFREHIIDIVQNPEEYKAMGIDFPAAFILQGPPGCGKTYAVEKLIDYLDWPSFFIDSGTIGSPYIHETSKKISALFDEAMDQAPAVLVIDEMESFLMDRANSGSGNGHHVEEVAEFLRRIPEAAKKHVLVIAMTNMASTIDPAILRKGRFDHIIEVGMPSSEEIMSIINNGLEKVPHDPNIEVAAFSAALQGRPISDVAFVLREAARITAKAHRKSISTEAFETAIASLAASSAVSDHRPIGFDVSPDERK